ncbi:S1 family peptidase [Rhodovulum marinum]|uniref:Trypsin-like peptidase n=1 Tax=Rhodovulum marinum TaxID=320662 RepID=A0A4R2Q5C7_9RHOB|nr:serine protease [Rhodovulum marinum]TCP41875.1 trypsin-like peptidase [Rhodovulum marinum]
MRQVISGRLSAVGLCAAGLLGLAAMPVQAAVEKTIVYVECTTPENKASRGSGVIVSAQGHVLTARHVAPFGSTCSGSIGVADPRNAQRLVLQPATAPVDAALLRFARQDDYDFMGYCGLEDWMVRKRIVVAGFPGETETGVPSYREGILSTVLANPSGVLETDGQSVAGMSGGPVFSRNLFGLVGIVSGAEFDISGEPNYYGIIPAASIARVFGLTEAERPCYREHREFDLRDPETGAWAAIWEAGDADNHLGVFEDEGFCFVQEIWGAWNHPEDYVAVTLQEGEYVMEGKNFSGETHGASARCIAYE